MLNLPDDLRAEDSANVVEQGAGGFAAIQACAAFDLPAAREIVRDALAALATKPRRNGTFGTPCQVERVAAALCGLRALEESR